MDLSSFVVRIMVFESYDGRMLRPRPRRSVPSRPSPFGHILSTRTSSTCASSSARWWRRKRVASSTCCCRQFNSSGSSQHRRPTFWRIVPVHCPGASQVYGGHPGKKKNLDHTHTFLSLSLPILGLASICFIHALLTIERNWGVVTLDKTTRLTQQLKRKQSGPIVDRKEYTAVSSFLFF